MLLKKEKKRKKWFHSEFDKTRNQKKWSDSCSMYYYSKRFYGFICRWASTCRFQFPCHSSPSREAKLHLQEIWISTVHPSQLNTTWSFPNSHNGTHIIAKKFYLWVTNTMAWDIRQGWRAVLHPDQDDHAAVEGVARAASLPLHAHLSEVRRHGPLTLLSKASLLWT